MSSTTTCTQVAITDSQESAGVRNPKRRRSSRVLALKTKSVEIATRDDHDKAATSTSAATDSHQRRQSYKLVSPSIISTNDDIEIPHEHFKDDEPSRYDTTGPVSVGFHAYFQLLLRYPMYRAYFVSHLCQNLGDWFVRIASILVVEEFSSSGKTIAHLSLSVLLPKAIFSQVGGVIADRFDRRICMILLDLLSGMVVLGYLVAIQYKSLNMMYAVTILRSSLGATYYPITTGLVPLLVPNPHDLQLAVTLNSFAWSISSIVGGLVAGGLMSQIGFSTCYYIDCVTFFGSAAWIYWGISGTFTVHNRAPHPSSVDLEENAACIDKPTTVFTFMAEVFSKAARYLSVCGFGLLVFQKSSASFVWGIEDIVGAEFSTVFREDGTEDEAVSSWHMGMLFSVIGAGCMVGPALVNFITDARFPHTLQRACFIGYCLLTIGWLLISTASTFPLFLVFSFVRVMGSGIAWVNSTLLLQTLCEPSVLGRVLAVEYTLTTLFEAASASISGGLEDQAGFSKNELALFGAGLGIIVVMFWGSYYFVVKGGAASPKYASVEVEAKKDSRMDAAAKTIEMSHIEKVMLEPDLPVIS